MTQSPWFKRIYFYFIRALVAVLNISVQVLTRGSGRLQIAPNPLYDRFEIEGAAPLLVFAADKPIRTFAWFPPLRRLFASLPFLAPLAILTREEFNERTLLCRNKATRFLLQLQKVVAVRRAFEKGEVTAKRVVGLVPLLESMGLNANTDDLRRAIETRMEDLARHEVNSPDKRLLPASDLRLTTRRQSADLNEFVLSPAALAFWSPVIYGRKFEAFDPALPLPPPYCIKPFTEMRLTCEGDAFMCCWQIGKEHSMGNVLQSSFADVWNSDVAQTARAEILRGEFPKVCATAEGCPYLFHEHRPGIFQGPLTQPLMIDLNLPNTQCNIGGEKPTLEKPACLMCERGVENYRFEDASRFDDVLAVIRGLMPRLRHIHIQGVAEPFWKDAFFKVLDRIGYDAFREKISLSTTTNGTVFTPQRQRTLLERCGVVCVSFSIDAATSATYRKIRRLDVFERLQDHIRHFGTLRKRYPRSRFRIQNNINLLNVDEVEGMVGFAAEVGVDCIELNPTAGGFDFLVTAETAPKFRDAQAKAIAEAEKCGVKVEFMRPLDMGLSTEEAHI